MRQSDRHEQILTILRRDGRADVEDLAAQFSVTLQTIRRDLGDLSDRGVVDRTHGGAVIRAGARNSSYDERRIAKADAKERIGRACAAMIPNNASLIMNIGTTAEAVARALLSHVDLTVITNNINVANILSENTGCEVIVAGGALRRSDGALIGEMTIEFFEQFKPDFAIIGCSAIDHDGDLLDFDLAEVRVSRAILRQSRQRFVVADHSKFQRSAPAKIGTLSDVNVLITDQPPPSSVASLVGTVESALQIVVADEVAP